MNFDETGERAERVEKLKENPTFTIGGIEFRRRAAVPAGIIERWEDATDVPAAAAVEIVSNTVREFIVPEDRTMWDDLRNNPPENPISYMDMLNVMFWLIQESSGRPTQGRSDSSDSPAEASGLRSVAVPSSPEPTPEPSTSEG